MPSITLADFADNSLSLPKAALAFFDGELNIKLITDSFKPLDPNKVFKTPTKADQQVLELLAPDGFFFLGTIDKGVLNPSTQQQLFTPPVPTLDERIAHFAAGKRDGIMVFGLELNKYPTRTELATFSRAFNRLSREAPVMVLFRHPDNPEAPVGNKLVSLATSERSAYRRADKVGVGEKVGKVALLRDMNPVATHTGHLRTLQKLRINDPSSKQKSVTTYSQLYEQWKNVFDVQLLNNAFYAELTAWYYQALAEIKLPFKHPHDNDANNKKNFLIRLIARTLFSWFLKEKGLIPAELLELEDLQRKPYVLLHDQAEPSDKFLASNSYYRGILQNVFFRALNKPQEAKKGKKSFTCTSYLTSGFDYHLLTGIPYLNGGIFDQLEEDNCQEATDDTKLRVPNHLFYGTPANDKGKAKTKERRGLNQILNSYAFTIEENTPAEEVIALDPELLGLVFESLLAELDPNLEEKTRNSIRKLTGSFYTPRKVIQEMVNESLFLHLNTYFRQLSQQAGPGQVCPVYKERLQHLLYDNHADAQDKAFCRHVVTALDQLKVLDPACGSGAFPMGMLQRVVQLLQFVDPKNQYWLERQLSKIPDVMLREQVEKEMRGQVDNYNRKLGIIKNCIYGIDIQPLAVQITKLRFFITLLIDQTRKEGALNQGIKPMPNLETKIVCANSLTTYAADRNMFSEDATQQLFDAHEEYYAYNLSAEKKAEISDKIVAILHAAVPTFAHQVTGKSTKDESGNKALLREWFQHGTVSAPFFDADLFFPELRRHPGQGFDIVIGNPPYGGTDIPKELAQALRLGSRDPYGAFVARFLGDGQGYAPLRAGGVLSFIISDTFMTIGSHLPLRQKLLHNYVHKMIRVHPDTFRATVNTVILVAERNLYDPNLPVEQKQIPAHHICQMVDLTNVSIHQQHDRFLELLHETEGFAAGQNKATPEYAVYYYPQQLIRTNSNLPFFVASPKLFALMNDTGREVIKKPVTLGGQEVTARVIPLNGQEVRVVKLGQIAEVKQGLATGDNHAYLFQNPEARGSYRSIDEYSQYLLTEDDLKRIWDDDELRLEIIGKGISKGRTKSSRYFEGRYIVPYDKGGESDAEEGWMPNYYVPTNYFIDWSEWAVKRLDTFTIAERIRDYKEEKEIKPHYETTTCAVIRSPNTYFNSSITFSRTGVYSPTFRLGSTSVYDTEGSMLFVNPALNLEPVMAILASKLAKYLLKNCIGHTVHCQVDELKEFPFVLAEAEALSKQVKAVMKKQEKNPRYDYASHEQLEIDKLVYQAYALTDADIAEVEAWYQRRYPRLGRATPAVAATPVATKA